MISEGYKTCVDCQRPIVGKMLFSHVVRCKKCQKRRRSTAVNEYIKRVRATAKQQQPAYCQRCATEITGRRITKLTRYCLTCTDIVQHENMRNWGKNQRATRKKIA